ncbi:MAG TPA: hypothetical protein VK729_05470, partial [Silvibacterium sp.]|nr:hypothetical protein [Silvibacterium sp.]
PHIRAKRSERTRLFAATGSQNREGTTEQRECASRESRVNFGRGVGIIGVVMAIAIAVTVSVATRGCMSRQA